MNSASKNKYQAYAAATQTVAKTQQIIMLYDGIIKLIQQGKDAIRENRIEDRFNLILKASNIIHGLQGCLDFENGGEIAKVLYSFYSSVDNKLFSVHRSNSVEMCDEVIADLKQMRDAWAAVDEQVLNEQAPKPAEASAEPPPAPNPNAAPSVILSA